MKTAYLGLGTNLGDRSANLAQAIAMLASERLIVKRVSSSYETAPRDFLDQPFFLNQVIEVTTDLFPRQLLDRAKQVERKMGRVKGVAKGPRVIDVDVLMYGHSVVSMPGLEIPHPSIAERRFVLEPLAELAPELRHPVHHRTIRQLLAAVGEQDVRRV
jgi:hypothetical protein